MKPTVARPGGGYGRASATAYVVGTVAGLFLGGVFFVAVWGFPPVRLGKVADPEAFAQLIGIEGLDVAFSDFFTAVLAIGIEAAIAFFLLLNVRRLWVLVPTALLVLFFLFLNGRAYLASLQGEVLEEVSCGCFGNLVDRTPAQAFWQDFALLVPPLLLAFLGRPAQADAVPVLRTALAGLLTLGTVVFAASAPDLDLDDVATRLRPGVRVAEICAGHGKERLCLAGDALVPWLLEGEHLVVLADLADEDFAHSVADRIEEIDEQVSQPGFPGVLVLYEGLRELEGAFQFRSRAPPFVYQDVPRALLRPLYRRLPRTFLVKDGVVTRTWSGLPPLAEVAP